MQCWTERSGHSPGQGAQNYTREASTQHAPAFNQAAKRKDDLVFLDDLLAESDCSAVKLI